MGNERTEANFDLGSDLKETLDAAHKLADSLAQVNGSTFPQQAQVLKGFGGYKGFQARVRGLRVL